MRSHRRSESRAPGGPGDAAAAVTDAVDAATRALDPATDAADPATDAADPASEAGARLRSRMVRRIVETGALDDPAWRAAFEDVPRHVFVPVYHPPSRRPEGYETLRADDPDPERRWRWLEGAYEDVPLVTRVRAGGPVSSSSQPSLMAVMLAALDVRDGDAVLEIGAGTGYNAALLAHRLGDASVTAVDLDEDITGPARDRLAVAGYRPSVVTGDGALGYAPHAPYDRIMATCAMPSVPVPWLRQCAPGALVLAPLASGLLRLTVLGAERAEGRFLATPAYFVALRGSEAPDPCTAPAPVDGDGRHRPERDVPGRDGPVEPRRRRTDTGPRALENAAFRFLLGLVAGELDVRWSFDTEQRRPNGVALAARDGSAASAGSREGSVLVTGPRDLWALVEDAYDLWQREGRPTRVRFGVTVEGGRQWSWLDDPTGEFRWPLPCVA